jgi:hypothetical protein
MTLVGGNMCRCVTEPVLYRDVSILVEKQLYQLFAPLLRSKVQRRLTEDLEINQSLLLCVLVSCGL